MIILPIRGMISVSPLYFLVTQVYAIIISFYFPLTPWGQDTNVPLFFSSFFLLYLENYCLSSFSFFLKLTSSSRLLSTTNLRGENIFFSLSHTHEYLILIHHFDNLYSYQLWASLATSNKLVTSQPFIASLPFSIYTLGWKPPNS